MGFAKILYAPKPRLVSRKSDPQNFFNGGGARSDVALSALRVWRRRLDSKAADLALT